MIIVSINNDTGEVRLASVMRDLILRMEEGSNMPYNKANAQYAQSGLSDTVSMINRNFGLDIGEYVTINWYSVATVIDQMGGVLEINSEKGVGTTVWITLPCVARDIRRRKTL